MRTPLPAAIVVPIKFPAIDIFQNELTSTSSATPIIPIRHRTPLKYGNDLPENVPPTKLDELLSDYPARD